MKRFSLLLIASMATLALSAQSFTEWQDAEVNEINRAPMHATYKIFNNAEAATGKYCDAAYPYRLSLNGTWRFNWVENADQRPTDFFALGYNDAACRGNLLLLLQQYLSQPGIYEKNDIKI